MKVYFGSERRGKRELEKKRGSLLEKNEGSGQEKYGGSGQGMCEMIQ